MKITMISNYINHHQIPFSQALYERIGEDYRFIQTEPMEEERVAMGWEVDITQLPYVVLLDEAPGYARELIEESDILLVGWTRREDLLVQRLAGEKLTIRISERLYREGQWKAVSPRGLWAKYREHTRYRKKPVYLLCAGAYVASDFSLVKAYPNKMFKFGYFPQTKKFTEQELAENHPWPKTRNGGEIQLVWAGRFLPLKHPEFALWVAERLKLEGYSFHLHLIGGGELEEEMRAFVSEKKLEDRITFYGFLKPQEVRRIMEKSHIHLFTSNHLEGWGAVVNEAMNSGCAEVASARAGAVPFLVRPGENGLIYQKDSFEDLLAQVRFLLDNPEQGEKMGKAAYKTIAEEWNEQEAAVRLLKFYEQWREGRISPPASGPFSVAGVISPAGS